MGYGTMNYPAAASHPQEEPSYFALMPLIFRRRWRLILAIVVLVSSTGLLWSSIQAPEYQATATVLIERDNSYPLEKDRNASGELVASPDYYETHVELLKSVRLLQKTAMKLGLSNRAEYKSV